MKWIEVKVVFDFNDRQLAVDLISDLLYELDFKGLVVEEPEVEGIEDWGSDAVTHKNDAVIGYLPFDDTLRRKRKTIEEGLIKLENQIGMTCRIFYTEIDEADWTESWKAYFRPEKITDQIVVKPTWKDYSPIDKEIIIEIDPGMAFGTGTHPTTRMCIVLLEKYLKKTDTFLDVGTGSGILMIAAAKLGAGKIWGTDNDPVAVDIARRNLIHNRTPESVFHVITGNMVDKITEQFDLVAANLTAKTIIILFENIQKVLVQGGILFCSGIIESDKDKVLEKMRHVGLNVIETLADGDWISMACRLM